MYVFIYFTVCLYLHTHVEKMRDAERFTSPPHQPKGCRGTLANCTTPGPDYVYGTATLCTEGESSAKIHK